jgi:hypothetical protein
LHFLHDYRTFRTPRGFFRFLDALLSVVVFALLWDVSRITSQAEFSFVLGATMSEFFWCIALMLIYIFEEQIVSRFDLSMLQALELIGDFVSWLVILAATIAGLFRCIDNFSINAVDTGQPLCYWQAGHNIEVAMIICFFLWISIGFSMKFSYRYNIDVTKKGYW